MQAWAVERPGPMSTGPLVAVRRPVPVPRPGEVLLRVTSCGVCRTDLHLAEGDLAPRRAGTVPGHQVIGRVVASGPDQHRFSAGDRAGIAWLRGTCGQCRWCRSGAENLCPESLYTGWDADGGFAEYAVVPAAFAYRLPEGPPDRCWRRFCAPASSATAPCGAHSCRPAAGSGIYGFGSSAHITAQVARARGAELYAVTRGEAGAELARSLGAVWVGGPDEPPPVELDSAIVFAPAGELVPLALAAVGRGGTVALAGHPHDRRPAPRL